MVRALNNRKRHWWASDGNLVESDCLSVSNISHNDTIIVHLLK